MHKTMIGVLVLAVLGILLFLVETHRTWSIILVLLALIFYGLFANPMHALHKEAFGNGNGKPKRKLKRKNR